MNDIRVIFVLLFLLAVIGCLVAKILAFSMAWILWPFGIIAVLLWLFWMIVSNPIL